VASRHRTGRNVPPRKKNVSLKQLIVAVLGGKAPAKSARRKESTSLK
tara:strand:- start:105 stop:245 length:141 start_codon:yes stop_codon:yes gene_type:complete